MGSGTSCELSDSEFLEKRLDKLYLQARGVVEHEDDLVDRRLKWAITISGFLFAAYGATWISWPEGALLVSQTDDENKVKVLALTLSRLAMAVLGFTSAIYSGFSVQAAHIAIRTVTRKYDTLISLNEYHIEKLGLQVWKLIGDRPKSLKGFASSNFLPFGIALVWCGLATIDCALLLEALEIHSVMRPEHIAQIDLFYVYVIGLVASWTAYCWLRFARNLKKESETGGLDAEIKLNSVEQISETSFQKVILDHKQQSLKRSENEDV